MKYLMSLFVLVLLCSPMLAQTIDNNRHKLEKQSNESIYVDSLDISTLYKKYYSDANFLDHSYGYESINKINKLRKWSRDVEKMGYASMLGVFFLNGYLADKYDWSLWVDIPCAVVVCGAVFYTFDRWSNKLEKRASAIEEQTAYLIQVGNSWDIGVTKYTNRYDDSYNALGFGFKVMF